MTDRSGQPWIQTFTGVRFYPFAADAADIHIEDIAHALSNECRYGGHPRSFYSVAQHSVLVSQICRPDNALHGLLHDASEAYLRDLPRPIKHAPGMEFYRQAEHNLQLVVARKFGLATEEPGDVKLADATALATERRDLMFPRNDPDWSHGARKCAPLSTRIVALPAPLAEALFLERWTELTHKPAPFTGTPYLEDGGW